MIRIEETRANKIHNFKLQNELHEHRVGPLRSHTRETLLAYMYLRNYPYLAVECQDSKALSLAACKNIRRMCRKYGNVEMNVSDWIAGNNLITRGSDESSGGLTPPRATKQASVAQLRQSVRF